MNINREGSSILVTGSGLQFLKLKAELCALISANDLKHINKNQVAFPLEILHLVLPVLIRFKIQIPIELLGQAEGQSERERAHNSAKCTIESNVKNSNSLTGDLFWDKTLDAKQRLAVNCMVTPGLLGMCLFDEQGAGKTVMAMATFDILHSKGEVDALWVVCPKSMVGEWPREFASFLGPKYSVSILEGSIDNRIKAIQSDADVLVTSFEGIRSHVELLSGIASQKKVALVVDESYYVKNTDAKRSKAILTVRRSCHVAYCLCGTPAPNRPEDIIHQFDVADGGYTFTGFKIPENRDQIIDAVTRRIDERGIWLRRLKSELLPTLPNKVFKLHPVRMRGRQALLYNKAREELILYLRGLDNVRFKKELGLYFQKRAALLQICVDPVAIDPSYNETPVKYSKLDQLVRDIVEQRGKKIVIWSFFKKSVDTISARYSRHGVVRVDGAVSSAAERQAAVLGFQTDPNIRIFVGNPAAAGAGITLHAASEAIYVSYSNQAAHYLQSIDRIHRRGQSAKEVVYHLLVCVETIEEIEISRLRNKEQKQGELLRDDIRLPSSLDEALAELENEE